MVGLGANAGDQAVKTFVLIHGTWHGGWAWKEVVGHLSGKGHVAHAPTLAGHGPGSMRKGIPHQDCVDSVAAYIRSRNLQKIVLVGHSFGGTVVQVLAGKFPDRISRIVFLDALILKDNERVVDILPQAFLDSLTAKNGSPVVAADNTKEVFPIPPWETWRDNFIQDAPEDLALSTWEHLSPEPAQVNLQNVDIKGFHSLTIPMSFIFCRQDRAMPPDYFHPGMSSRLGTCKLLEMDGSHEVMFTHPGELAERLVEASADDALDSPNPVGSESLN